MQIQKWKKKYDNSNGTNNANVVESEVRYSFNSFWNEDWHGHWTQYDCDEKAF